MSQEQKKRTGRTSPRYALIAAAASATLLLGTAACGGSEGSTSSDTFKVGIIAPLSGANAEDGTAYLKAAKAALKEAGSELDQKIEVVQYDEATETAKAVSGTRRLTQRDGVDALLSGSTSGNFLATQKIIDQAQIPALTVATSPKILEDNAGWSFRISQPLGGRIDDNVHFATDQLKAKKVAFLQVNDETQRAFVKAARAGFKAEGVEVVGESYFQYGDTDFSPYLQKLRSKSPDVTFLGCEVGQCATIIDQAKKAGVSTNFVLPTAASAQGFLDGYGAEAEGSFVQTIYAPGAMEKTAEFEAIAKKKGFPASYYSVVAYSEAKALIGAVKTANSTDPQAVRDALAKGSFDSPLGKISFLKNGQAKAAGFVAEVSDSKYVYRWPKRKN